MAKINHYIINRHQDIFKYLLILIAIGLIILWLPIGGKFKYEFSKGKVWQYEEELYAPFDFPVKKGMEEISLEKNQLLEDFVPYYRLDKNEFRHVEIKFEKAFLKKYEKVIFSAKNDTINRRKIKFRKDYLHNKGFEILKELYDAGIVNNDQLQLFDTELIHINLLRGNLSNHTRIIDIYSIEQAKSFIHQSLSAENHTIKTFLTPLLEDLIAPNVFYDEETTLNFQKEITGNIALTKGIIQKDELIISKGLIINDEKHQILVSLKEAYEKNSGKLRNEYITYLGYFIMICLSLSIVLVHIILNKPNIFNSNRNLMFILFVIVLFTSIIGWVNKYDLISVYVIPVCIIPIVIRAFFDIITALFTQITVILIYGFIVPNSYEFVFLNLIAGVFTVFSIRQLHYRSQFYKTALIMLTAYCLGHLGLIFVQDGSIQNFEWTTLGWLCLNVVFTLLAFPLISIFEKIFGLVSEITIFELSDLNKPLLKELSIKAPGTFQHSLQVANLAEAGAYALDANPMLARVGSLYHDIGKMYSPTYFIENQITGINPHDELSFEDSARIIIEHVIKGIELGKKHHLPDIIIDFIRTHHGNSRVEYFYQSFLKSYPDVEVDEEKFRYPGPVPFSKETGIVMLADSVEAASRSLKKPNEDDIDKLVEGIINHKVKENQLIQCDITFSDITRLKTLYKKMLKSIYHVRISYPKESLD